MSNIRTAAYTVLTNMIYGLPALNVDLDLLLARLGVPVETTHHGYLVSMHGSLLEDLEVIFWDTEDIRDLLGDINARTNLKSLLAILGWADVAGVQTFEQRLGYQTSGMIETDLDSLLTKSDRKVCSMTFLSVINNEIDLPAAAADTNLPDVVISGLPTGATLDKVLVFLIIRAIENTNAGGANAIQGTQYIRIKKSTGAWGVDDVAAIQLIDNLWTVAASTREFGDVIGGDDARDVKSEVDGNATYNLRFENADVDLDFLRLNDVQVLIKVWYH